MNDDQFTKLFKYIEEFRGDMTSELAEVRDDIRGLRDAPDVVAKRLDGSDVKQVARDAQWNRLLEWAREVSKKTGVPMPDL